MRNAPGRRGRVEVHTNLRSGAIVHQDAPSGGAGDSPLGRLPAVRRSGSPVPQRHHPFRRADGLSDMALGVLRDVRQPETSSCPDLCDLPIHQCHVWRQACGISCAKARRSDWLPVRYRRRCASRCRSHRDPLSPTLDTEPPNSAPGVADSSWRPVLSLPVRGCYRSTPSAHHRPRCRYTRHAESPHTPRGLRRQRCRSSVTASARRSFLAASISCMWRTASRTTSLAFV